MRKLNITAIGTVLVNFILNLIFIPKHGAYGAAWASLITLFGSAIIQALIAASHFKMKWNIQLISKILIFSLAIIALCYGFLFLNMNWFIEFIIIGIFGIGLAFATRLFQVKEFISIVKEEQL